MDNLLYWAIFIAVILFVTVWQFLGLPSEGDLPTTYRALNNHEAGNIQYVRLGDLDCVQVDMRGDPETYFAPTTKIIRTRRIGDGWIRYWYVSNWGERA